MSQASKFDEELDQGPAPDPQRVSELNNRPTVPQSAGPNPPNPPPGCKGHPAVAGGVTPGAVGVEEAYGPSASSGEEAMASPTPAKSIE